MVSLYHNHSVIQSKSEDDLDVELFQFLTMQYFELFGTLTGEIQTHSDLEGLLVELQFPEGKGVTHIGGSFADNYFSPKNRFIPFYQEPGDIGHLRSYKPKAVSGIYNGIRFLFDAETYDYTSNVVDEFVDCKGFTVGLSHPFDFDLSEFHGIHIEPGKVIDIQVSTKLIVTPDVDYMKSRFDADVRKCYFEDEVHLTHFPSWRFRYSMTNCLVEAQIQKLEQICNCTPAHAPLIPPQYDVCKVDGFSWNCLVENYVEIGTILTFENSGQIQECQANCIDQPYEFTFTTTKLAFLKDSWKFCPIIKKLLKSCKTFKNVTLEESYPGICEGLAVFDNNIEETICVREFEDQMVC